MSFVTYKRKKNMIKMTENERKKELPFVDIAPPVAHPLNKATIYFLHLF